MIKEQFESSNNYLVPSEDYKKFGSVQGKDMSGKTYHIHFVDYLQNNRFKRIQDAIDAAQNYDKIIVN